MKHKSTHFLSFGKEFNIFSNCRRNYNFYYHSVYCILYPVKPYFNDIYIHQKRSCVAENIDVVKDTNYSKAHQTNVNQQSIAFTVTCAVSILKCVHRQCLDLSQIIFLHPKHYLVSQDNIKQKHKGCISRASFL